MFSLISSIVCITMSTQTYCFVAINRLEQESIDFRRQRDSAIDERDSLQKMVDRRNTELQRMQEDVKMLNTQLKDAINTKCEAIAKYEGVQSQQVTLDYK